MKKLVCMLSLLAVLLCLCMAGMAEDGAIAGKPFPEFSFTDLEGNSVSLAKAGEGKKLTVVYLFSAFDEGCMDVFPEMEEVYQAHKEEMAYVAVTGRYSEDPEIVRNFSKEHTVSAVLGTAEEKMVLYLNPETLPCILFIDRNGNAACVIRHDSSKGRE